MARLKMLTTNYGDTATLSGGGWQATLPLANLQQRQLALVARSLSAALIHTYIDIDLGNTSSVVRVLGFVRHNLSTAATVTVTAGSTIGGSDKYSGAATAVWPVVYSYTDLPYGHPNWWNGLVGAADAANYPLKLIYDPGTSILARYWRIQITDTANAAGYVQLARFFAGPLWSPAVNYSWGDSLTWQPNTREERALGGALFFDQRPAMRVFDFALESLTATEAFGQWLDLQRTAGTYGEVLVIPDSADTARRNRRDIWGRMRRFDPIIDFAFGQYKTAVTIEELL